MARAALLDRYVPKVATFIKALLEDGDVGVCVDSPRIADPKTGLSYPPKTAVLCDRFKVIIPYAGVRLRWEVIFGHDEQDMPPDFIFGPADQEFVPATEEIQSLVNWDADNPRSLTNVLHELVQAYKEHHISLLNANSHDLPRVQFEYATLASHGNYPDFELHVRKDAQTFETVVNILIKLPLDLHKVPEYLIDGCPGEDAAGLLISYRSPDGHQVVPSLYLSPRLERAVGSNAALRIPQWGGTDGSCLFDYLPKVHNFLSQKIEQVCSRYHKREEYVAAFLSAFGRSVLEYDAKSFHKISLLFSEGGFFCIVHIHLPENFPQDQPVMTLQSIYHEYQGMPYDMVEKDSRYSPSWSGVEMAERTRAFLMKKIPEFKETSLSNGKF